MTVWSPPAGVLGALTSAARERAGLLKGRASELREMAQIAPERPSFSEALRQGSTVAVIAEVKRRSPSKGDINLSIDAAQRARAYEEGGAAAISVLTEPSNFGGSIEDLGDVCRAVRIPVLRKDFIVDPLQLLEAKGTGASAALLIVRALHPDHLRELADAAASIGLEVLAEARSEAELDLALSLRDAVVGVNNRNLETLVIDTAVGERLLPRVYRGRAAVFESGVSERAHVELAARAHADAVLVGSAISGAVDGAEAVRRLTGVPRRARAPLVKFCGLTRADDAANVARFGARYAGVIFAGGPRMLDAARAAAVLASVPAGVKKVGVFGAAGVDHIAARAEELHLDVVQLHGGGTPGEIAELRRRFGGEIWAVVRSGDLPSRQVASELAEVADGVLVDSGTRGSPGGTGVTFDWRTVRALRAATRGAKLILAGGLVADNVARAIREAGPDVVDVSSGVETAPGIKDAERMRQFTLAVEAASEN